ncbi:MAG: hypothetical protein J0M12_01160 [Deltaproteobacteria bacterium]|nr:hypothetical protein [Deltaproteobacteria bacterium]
MHEQAQFNGMIGPLNLLSLVKNTAPFLFEPPYEAHVNPAKRLIEMGADPLGFIHILHNAHSLTPTAEPSAAEREDYFALCLACHHATVATFVPTDVDSKIRGVLWYRREDRELLRQRFEFVLQAMNWTLDGISTRATALSGVGPVSGHNGEMLGVLAGALGSFIFNGDLEYADKAAEAIDGELRREVHELQYALNLRGHEVDLLKISMSLLHNVGDLDQGISFWKNTEAFAPYRKRFAKLGHENTTPYGGAFVVAGALYKTLLASEGHRHYPLREVKALRKSRYLLLPLGPFLDDWGATIGRQSVLTDEERAEVLSALLQGCKKIPGQQGYYRAIAGMAEACGGQFERICKLMPASSRALAKDPDFKKKIAVSKISFESSYRKRTQTILAGQPAIRPFADAALA